MTAFNTRSLRPLALLLALTLAGCAGGGDTAPASYLLPAVPGSDDQHTARLSVEVAPVTMAAFLAGDGIVMQLDDIEIHQARNHHWADALPDQLRQRLIARLSQHLPEAQIIYRGQPAIGDLPRREIRLQLDRFQGRYDGMAVIQGHWQLLNERGELLQQQSFEEELPLTGDGYPALVRTLAGGWTQIADRLAVALAASLVP